MYFPLGALFLCECHADQVHLACQMRCFFGVLKRGALLFPRWFKLQNRCQHVNGIVEALTASESVNSLHSSKNYSRPMKSSWLSKLHTTSWKERRRCRGCPKRIWLCAANRAACCNKNCCKASR